MKHLYLLLVMVGLSCLTITAQTPSMRYVDAHELQVINRTYADTVPLYTRVPASMKSMVREEIRWGMDCSTGIAIRFRTNSPVIGARYRLRYDFAMSWMAYTGIKGTDLYIFDDEKQEWHYLGTGRPQKDSVQTITYARHLDGRFHEYMLFLPLYDGITEFAVGVSPESDISGPRMHLPRRDVRVVFWGTSVMQGGCAARPGMTQTAILTRELGIECCNMGVSGEGKMWKENAQLLAAAYKPDCYVIDPLMNCTHGMVDTMTIDFIQTIRDAHPLVPIIMVEGLLFPDYPFNSTLCDSLPEKNAAFYRNYLLLKKSGMKNLYYLPSKAFNGRGWDTTVDTWHFTDYGFRLYADEIKPLLKKALKKSKAL